MVADRNPVNSLTLIFFIHYHDCSRESWQDGTTRQDLSEHTNVGHPYLRSRSLKLVEILENTLTVIFSDCVTTTVYQNPTCLDNLQPKSRSWPSVKVKVNFHPDRLEKRGHLYSYRLSKYACLDNLQSRSRSYVSAKVKVTSPNRQSWKMWASARKPFLYEVGSLNRVGKLHYKLSMCSSCMLLNGLVTYYCRL